METREEHYASMMQAVQRYAPSADLEEIQKAYEYADRKHKNQLRKSGEPYIIHPLAVAEIVAEIGLDTDAIVAALLHDCLEDTDASFDEISHMFGQTVAELVEGVTKLTRVQYSTTEEQQMENLRKMFMAMSKDIRVILIKIADRLHNTRTLQYQTPAKQISKSMETMEIYAPLAHRLGMQKIKWELEDVSLQYLDPEGYRAMNQLCFEGGMFSRRVVDKIGLPDARFFIYGDDACYGYVASQHFPAAVVADVVLKRARAVSNWDIAGKRQLNSTSDTNRYYIMRNRGYLARYMQIYGDYHPVLFRLGNAATFCKEFIRLAAVDKCFKTGIPALRRGMKDARKIIKDPNWKPMPPMKATK